LDDVDDYRVKENERNYQKTDPFILLFFHAEIVTATAADAIKTKTPVA
jgi:hypothetical protein